MFLNMQTLGMTQLAHCWYFVVDTRLRLWVWLVGEANKLLGELDGFVATEAPVVWVLRDVLPLGAC